MRPVEKPASNQAEVGLDSDPRARMHDFASRWCAENKPPPPVGTCWICQGPLNDFGIVVKGTRVVRRRRNLVDGAVCLSCHGAPTHTFNNGARFAPIEPGTPRACEHCGQLVIRRHSPRLTRWTCSPTCRAALRSVDASPSTPRPTACHDCGTIFTPARSSGIYCTGRCRLRAYRRRAATASPPH
jgi:hypothetical protein